MKCLPVQSSCGEAIGKQIMTGADQVPVLKNGGRKWLF